MKYFSQKFFAVIFIIALASGCASSLTAPEAEKKAQTENEQITNNDKPNKPVYGTDQDMQTVRDKPDMDGEASGK